MIAKQTCDRCGQPTWATSMSWFNTDQLCLECEDEERAHPDFQKARSAEEAAVRRGDHNFPGIGWPG